MERTTCYYLEKESENETVSTSSKNSSKLAYPSRGLSVMTSFSGFVVHYQLEEKKEQKYAFTVLGLAHSFFAAINSLSNGISSSS